MKGGHCDFPFVGRNCSVLFSEILGRNYLYSRLLFLALGLIAFVATSWQLKMGYKLKVSTFLKRMYWLQTIGAAVFIVRSVDPYGYGGIYSLLAQQLWLDLSAAILASMGYTYVFFWNSLLTSNVSPTHEWKGLQLLFLGLNLFTYLTLFGFSLFAVLYCESLYSILNGIKSCIISFILFIVLISSLINGFRTRQRLASMTVDHQPKTYCFCLPRYFIFLIIIGIYDLIVLIVEIIRLFFMFGPHRHYMYKWYQCSTDNICESKFIFPYLTITHYSGLCICFWAFLKSRHPKKLQEVANDEFRESASSFHLSECSRIEISRV